MIHRLTALLRSGGGQICVLRRSTVSSLASGGASGRGGCRRCGRRAQLSASSPTPHLRAYLSVGRSCSRCHLVSPTRLVTGDGDMRPMACPNVPLALSNVYVSIAPRPARTVETGDWNRYHTCFVAFGNFRRQRVCGRSSRFVGLLDSWAFLACLRSARMAQRVSRCANAT